MHLLELGVERSASSLHAQKILLVSNEMTYTGAPRSLLNIARIFKESGADVDVWTLKNGDYQKEFENEQIHVKVFPEMIKEDKIRRYNLIILNTFFTAHLAKRFQKLTRTILYIREAYNIPTLARDCGLDMDDIRKADEVICISEYAEAFIRKNCMPHKLLVLHNFVKDDYNGQLNLVRGGMVHFLLSGTYEERKGYDVAIDSFLRMPEKIKRITRLHIVGRTPEWSRYFWERLREKYDDRIIEYGEISDEAERLKLYRQMNVFVIASRDEACSLVALEGAMLGKALIMSENVGAQYLDKKRKAVYPTEDVEALCRKMCEMTSRRELLVRGIEMRKAYKQMATMETYKREFAKLMK